MVDHFPKQGHQQGQQAHSEAVEWPKADIYRAAFARVATVNRFFLPSDVGGDEQAFKQGRLMAPGMLVRAVVASGWPSLALVSKSHPFPPKTAALEDTSRVEGVVAVAHAVDLSART